MICKIFATPLWKYAELKALKAELKSGMKAITPHTMIIRFFQDLLNSLMYAITPDKEKHGR